jgi:hypothetical protein
MSTSNHSAPPDFDEDFLRAIARWKEQFKIKDDDPIILLLELFRVHQAHWDEIRDRQMPSLNEFKADITALTEAAAILRRRAEREIRVVELPAAIIAVAVAAIAGFLIAKFL